VLTELATLTESTAGLLETQLTVRPVSVLLFTSRGKAVRTCVPPTTIGVVGDERLTVVTETGLTVITGVVAVFDSLVPVIVAVPVPTAVTVAEEPLALTVRTAVLLDNQVMVRPVSTLSFASFVTAVNC
jgi:hypothetical protein